MTDQSPAATEYGDGPGDPRSPALDWRRALPRLLAPFLLSRLLVLLVAGSLYAIPIAHEPDTWTDRPILAELTGSDSVYYLGIADEGYHLDPVRPGYHDWAFFPLYPVTVRAFSLLTLGDLAVAGILVSNLAFLGALLVLHALSVRHIGFEASIRAAGFMSLAPGAVAFAMAYTDSLFLLLSAGAFLAAERRRWWLMGALYGLATLTRLPGVLLAIPLALLILPATGWRPAWPLRIPWSLAWLLPGPVALIGFSLFMGALTGDPLAYVHAQAAWTIPPVLGEPATASKPEVNLLPWMLIGTLLLYTSLIVFRRADRIAPPYAALMVLSVATVILSGRLQSVARYLAVAWPFTWVLARRRAAWFRESWPYVTAGLFTLHAFLHFTQALAP